MLRNASEPRLNGPALSGARTPPTDGFFNVTNYIGAFSTSNWAKGWSAISSLGYLTDADAATPDQPVVSGSTTKLFALSNRLTLAANGTFFGGFVLDGTQSKTVLIRAVGPTLTIFGVSGALADPTLRVIDATGVTIASNDNWAATLAPTFAQIGAFPLTPASRDAALLVTLPAGSTYTIQVSGVSNTTGEALVEVYEVF